MPSTLSTGVPTFLSTAMMSLEPTRLSWGIPPPDPSVMTQRI